MTSFSSLSSTVLKSQQHYSLAAHSHHHQNLLSLTITACRIVHNSASSPLAASSWDAKSAAEHEVLVKRLEGLHDASRNTTTAASSSVNCSSRGEKLPMQYAALATTPGYVQPALPSCGAAPVPGPQCTPKPAALAAASLQAPSSTAAAPLRTEQLDGQEALARQQSHSGQLGNMKRLLSGAVSAIVSRTFVAPLERVKLELVLRNTTKTKVVDIARDIWAREGIRGFWKAHLINILRTTPYKAINYASYDLYKAQLSKLTAAHSADEQLGRFVAGALAGLTAMTTCFPLDVIRTRMLATAQHSLLHQHRHHHAQHRHHTQHAATRGTPAAIQQRQGMTGILRNIVATEGIGGLYSGCLPALISIVPSGAVFYGLFDLLKDTYLEARLQRQVLARPSVPPCEPPDDRIGATLTLLFGAVAGAAAETTVYPLEVIRRRMQLQSIARAASVSGGLAGAAAGTAARGVMAQTVHSTSWQRFIGIAALIWQTEGVRGFYVGLLPNVLQVLPNAALSYYTYDLLKRALNAQ